MEKALNRLALFVGQADEAYQRHFISGFNEKAIAGGFDVCVFSMYRKYQDTPENEMGESNIFSLMNTDRFDGAVILKDSILTESVVSDLEDRLNRNFNKPVVIAEKESGLSKSIYIDSYSAAFEIISHLTDVHGCRDIAFISEKKENRHTKERLRAYYDAMEKAGLAVSAERIIYVDHRLQSGEEYAEQLVSQGETLPDAVVCTDDRMAARLCKALTDRDIRVPEDIAVVGCEYYSDGQADKRMITSVLVPTEDFGGYAFDFLMKRLNGDISEEYAFKPETKLLLGKSCGCCNENIPKKYIANMTWETVEDEESSPVVNTMDAALISQTTLEEYLNSVYSYIYQLGDIEEFHLCLDSRWENMSNNVRVPNEGYNSSMIHVVRYYSDHQNNMTGLENKFPSADMLPDLDNEHDTPAVYFFTSVFFGEDCFGYAAVRYQAQEFPYDEIYRRWIDSVNRGFEVLKRNICLIAAQKQLESMRDSKFAVNSYAFDSLNEQEKEEYRLVTKILDDNLFNYHFQPIVNAQNGAIFAYEALMRSRTEKKVSPLSIIKYATMQERLFDVERYTFMNILRIFDEKREAFGNAKVFINSIPGVMVNDGDLFEISSYLEKNSDNVVIELTEEAELNDEDLTKLKLFYQKRNIDIAVDDYGTGYSNVSNLLRYMPDYVKIDRSLISDINNQLKKQHFVREIVDFCHSNNIMALAEGVETSDEMRTVINLGIDLIQGFYTAMPSAEIVGQIDEKRRSEIKQYYRECMDGKSKKVYYSGKTDRILLARLIRDGYSDIVIGSDGMVYNDISVIGIPNMKTNINLRIESGYCGRITFEDVYFANTDKRSCIELGENTDVVIVLLGTNTLFGSGIQVPESARLTLEGKGKLEIELNLAEFYGIGNDHYSRHGELVFEQDGLVRIDCRGQKGIAIGSGLGGEIHINRGEYRIESNNEECVGIGAMKGSVDLAINMCKIEADYIVTSGVLIGSLENDASVSIRHSSVAFYGFGNNLSVIGSIKGERVSVKTERIGAVINATANESTLFGALNGVSEISVVDSALKFENTGERALLFGGYDANTTLELLDSYTQAVAHSAIGKDTLASDENIRIVNGRRRIIVNDAEIERPIIYDFTRS